mmetsp:Transcript_17759/g.25071  ORF Transcript_17759/g.25071 Transcript_17759/m.25071 type:complete len:276 (+) Transcript_17759:69-896(+)|eukprot:CAMPEP_0184865772 /NCGR_PEP_ID=MMETSP0580-20130426/19028_1 /TAXON_ID=1118495 /ORGANISM="Dactyliosolen fragilissimus" /LENGTH=275 /DNA_ID=CAMNT_0027365087 /DNA_START=15 /DNA_END=842 /DNA_ORIENTATION=+
MMQRNISILLSMALMISSTSHAFVSQHDVCVMRNEKLELSMSATTDPNDVDNDEIDVSPMLTSTIDQNEKLPKYSQSIPFLRRPEQLRGELAGDVGFDPLGFAKNRELLFEYREAEVKHARLAMLAAAGWPISELYDARIASYFHIEPAVDAYDRAPSLFNGGMDRISPVWWGFCVGLTAAIDLYGVQRARAAGADSGYIPGDLDFDPLGLYPDEPVDRKNMELAEIKHGRLAMIAVTAFSVQEAVTKEGVVDETPFFFRPITQTLQPLFDSLSN